MAFMSTSSFRTPASAACTTVLTSLAVRHVGNHPCPHPFLPTLPRVLKSLDGAATRETVGDLLAARRRRRFVGRRAELELVRAALEAADPPFAVLHVHGPGGIGKTSLLDAVAELGDGRRAVVRLDARSVGASRQAVLTALGGHLEVPPAPAPLSAGEADLLLLVDGYDQLAPLDAWFREDLLPRLPRSSLTVLAGRSPVPPEWRADPAWHEVLRSVSLRNLDPADSRRYLTARGVDPVLQPRIVAVSHGHPLGLSLLADLVVGGADLGEDPLTRTSWPRSCTSSSRPCRVCAPPRA